MISRCRFGWPWNTSWPSNATRLVCRVVDWKWSRLSLHNQHMFVMEFKRNVRMIVADHVQRASCAFSCRRFSCTALSCDHDSSQAHFSRSRPGAPLFHLFTRKQFNDPRFVHVFHAAGSSSSAFSRLSCVFVVHARRDR